MLNRITISRRIWIGLIAYTLLFALAIGAALLGQVSARDSLARVHADRMVTSESLKTLRSGYLHNRIEMLLLFQHAPDSPTLELHPHPVTLHFDNIAAGRAANNAALEQITQRSVSPEEQTLIDDMMAKRRAWQQQRDRVLDAIRQGDFSVATMQFLLVAGRTQGLAFERAIVALADYQAQAAVRETERATANYHFNIALFTGILLLGVLPIFVFMIAAMRRMSSGLANAKHNAANIANGDLSLDIPVQNGDDEVAHLLTQLRLMQDNLRQLIRQVLAAAEIGRASCRERV